MDDGTANSIATSARLTGRLLDRTKDGRALSFNVDSPQKWHDSWRNADRIMRYYGTCKSCGRRTYAFDDGENDPRGVLGDHSADPITLSEHLSKEEGEEVRRVGDVTIPACFCCTNDYNAYKYLLDVATRKARRKGADI